MDEKIRDSNQAEAKKAFYRMQLEKFLRSIHSFYEDKINSKGAGRYNAQALQHIPLKSPRVMVPGQPNVHLPMTYNNIGLPMPRVQDHILKPRNLPELDNARCLCSQKPTAGKTIKCSNCSLVVHAKCHQIITVRHYPLLNDIYIHV